MAAPSIALTPEAIGKHRENLTYHVVGGKTRTPGRAKISGAETRWKKDPNFVFIPDLRIAGSIDDVQKYLTEIGQMQFLGTAITSQNYHQSREYQNEIRQIREKRIQPAPTASLTELPSILEQYRRRPTEATPTQGKRKPGRPKSPSPKAKRASPQPRKSLQEKVTEIELAHKRGDKTKVIDISNMSPETHESGARIITAPTRHYTVTEGRGKPRYVPQAYPYIASNNEEAIRYALGTILHYKPEEVDAVIDSWRRARMERSPPPQAPSVSAAPAAPVRESPLREASPRGPSPRGPGLPRVSPRGPSPRGTSPLGTSPLGTSPLGTSPRGLPGVVNFTGAQTGSLGAAVPALPPIASIRSPPSR